MLVPIEITEIFKEFLNKNDLGPTKFFYSGEKPKREYNETEKKRLRSLTEIYKKLALKQIKPQQLKEEIEKNLQISSALATEISKQIEDNYKYPEEETIAPKLEQEQNKKSIFSTLIDEKK